MQIKSVKRPWVKEGSHRHNERYGDRSFYQSKAWKNIVDFIWQRDKSMCQLCLQNGIKHYLERGTTDRSIQGTVDHKKQRRITGNDDVDNLWLIGTNHHDRKSANEKNEMYKK